MFFPPRSEAARAASQSSRDKSEVRGGEYGVSGNAGSVHALLQVGCLATPRAPSPEKLTLISVCMCTCSAPRPPLLSTACGLCPVLLTGGCFSLCHGVPEPSALYFPLPLSASTGSAMSLPVLQLHPCFVTCPGAPPYHNPSHPWVMAGFFFHNLVSMVQEPSTCSNTAVVMTDTGTPGWCKGELFIAKNPVFLSS